MCLLCIEIAKGKMTMLEVEKALGEFVPPVEHEQELVDAIINHYSLSIEEVDSRSLAEHLQTLDFRQFSGEDV